MNISARNAVIPSTTARLTEAAKPYDVDIMMRASETFKGAACCVNLTAPPAPARSPS